MTEIWHGITDAQATIIAGVFYVLAAIAGVWFGSWLFGNKVQNLEGAIEETEKIMKAHRNEVNETLTQLREGLGQLRGTVGDIQSIPPSDTYNDDEWAAWESLRESWNDIRDELERIAADPEINPRTRAKYYRIDRRQYWKLIEALGADGRIRGRQATFVAANNLWQRYKSGRPAPDQAAVREMEKLKKRILTTTADGGEE
jgi:hypothetical protein